MEVSAQAGEIACCIAGEVDLANSPDLFAAIARVVAPDTDRLLIDLTEVTYLDSAGLALLVDISDRLQVRRTRLVLVAPEGSPARRLLTISGLDKVIDLQS